MKSFGDVAAEQAHLGDPMKDWASALFRGVDNLLPREELFAEWEKESGLRIDQDRDLVQRCVTQMPGSNELPKGPQDADIVQTRQDCVAAPFGSAGVRYCPESRTSSAAGMVPYYF